MSYSRMILTALAVVVLSGCGGGDRKSSSNNDAAAANPARKTAVDPAVQTAAADPAPGTVDINFKIGIMTGTVSQGEDEFRAAQMISRKYPGHVRHVTYPDNFMNEQETMIGQLVSLASDPDVKVIVVSQAVPGSIAALRKIRETRPDIKIGFIEPHEDPALVNEAADIAIQPDQLARGRTIIETAKKMGATHFIHYSFPRHMSQELLARRRDIMKETCAANGIEFHFVTAPDPMAEGGLPATQQFVLEDVPRELEKFGPQTAFFSTNCGMMDPLIRSVVGHGGYFPEQCCPSPTHGYPTALGIAIADDKKGDFQYINAQNKAKIAEAKMSGHFATWPVPEVIMNTRAVTDLLVDSVQGKADYKDMATVQKYIAQAQKDLYDGQAVPVKVAKYDEKTGNSYLVLVDDIYY